MGERGSSLIEVVVVVAITAMLIAAGVGLTQGSRPVAIGPAAVAFGGLLAAAQAVASTSGNGATIVVEPLETGARMTLYSGRPNGLAAMARTTIPPLQTQADVSELSAGAPPFALFVAGSGHISLQPHYPEPAWYDRPDIPSITTGEPACPAAGHYVLNFQVNAASQSRTLFCQTTLAGSPSP
ncbi:MAG: hypothetical protein ABI182_02600 [Candidatus Baltobacteraceae bacterium]